MLSGRQKEIVEISVGLVADKGIQNLTIKNIAAELKISEPAIYRHFNSKFDILDAVLDSFEGVAVDVLTKVTSSDIPPLDRIEMFMSDRLTRMAANPKLAKVMFAEELFQDDDRLAKKVMSIMHSHKDYIQQTLEDGQKDGSIRSDIDQITLFRLIFGPLRLLIKQWALSGFRFDLKTEGKKLWDAEKKLLTP
ncbi:MAG: TetR/AcrR family transcriptional regulator [Victivallaceae bacterium]